MLKSNRFWRKIEKFWGDRHNTGIKWLALKEVSGKTFPVSSTEQNFNCLLALWTRLAILEYPFDICGGFPLWSSQFQYLCIWHWRTKKTAILLYIKRQDVLKWKYTTYIHSSKFPQFVICDLQLPSSVLAARKIFLKKFSCDYKELWIWSWMWMYLAVWNIYVMQMQLDNVQ